MLTGLSYYYLTAAAEDGLIIPIFEGGKGGTEHVPWVSEGLHLAE